MRWNNLKAAILLVALTTCVGHIAPSWATSIKRIAFSELIEKSELVFEGSVIAKQADWNASKTQIVTAVEFQVREIIKGKHSSSNITLFFLGGSVGEFKQEVAEMIHPQVNEKGIYFVGSSTSKMVNPLIGWSQGHYIIKGDEMLTNKREKIIGMTELSVEQENVFELSHGIPKGMRVKGFNAAAQAMSVREFKQAIKARQ